MLENIARLRVKIMIAAFITDNTVPVVVTKSRILRYRCLQEKSQEGLLTQARHSYLAEREQEL